VSDIIKQSHILSPRIVSKLFYQLMQTTCFSLSDLFDVHGMNTLSIYFIFITTSRIEIC